jgi:glycopeptide antibiotics resistance protein
MNPGTQVPDADHAKRGWPLGLLCILYVLLLIYGALMPFDLNADWDGIAARFENACHSWPFGDTLLGQKRTFVDGVFFIPLGFLLATHWTLERNSSRAMAFAAAAVLAIAASATVEGLQLFTLTRHAKACDLMTEASGGILGAVLGALTARAVWFRVGRFSLRNVNRPIIWAASVMAILIFLDAMDPLLPVTSLSSLKQNLLASRMGLREGLAEHPWYHWLVCRVGVYVAFAVLLGASSRRASWRRWLLGGMLAVGFALVAEAATPLMESRHAVAAHVVAAACGALVGMALGAVFSGRLSYRSKIVLAASLLLAFMAYKEWRPFTFEWNVAMMEAKIPSGAAWLPMASLALRGYWLDDVRDLLAMGVWSAAFVYILMLRDGWLTKGASAARLWKSATVATALGLALELPQFLLREREPSTTHVFIFVVGGLAGAIAHMLGPAGTRAPICSRAR